MDAALVAQFWGIGLLLTLTPGADWAYSIAAGVRARSIVPSITGILAGYVVVIVAVAFGVGALVTEFPMVLSALTFAGALYLVWLGIGTLRSRTTEISASDRDLGTGNIAQFFRGAGVSGINPKGILLLMALLPQFVAAEGAAASLQMLTLGSIHLLNSAIVYTVIALLARSLLKAKPGWATRVGTVSGTLMIVFGCMLFGEQIAELTGMI
ncbi:LysE family translocator [Gulosibacter chungangensis]|uniref:LysE family translocator n=1 Tax=Gulosibacter chungangensis TaxID=979746 RepID=A0A7J5B9D9_9MICO|nr:LysE family translocator [Gulosibacter chungangensis]KAB1642198.1 LysE family translocator [Gulosibacter chungangensis]